MLSWRRLPWSEPEREQLEGVIGEIAVELATAEVETPSLWSGGGGLALLQAYLLRVRGLPEDRDRFGAALEAVRPEAGRGGPLFPATFSPGWALSHCLALLGGEAGGLLQPLDEALERALGGATLARQGFDLISGLVGLGVYALERLPASEDSLARIATALIERAEEDGAGCCWPISRDELPPFARADKPERIRYVGVAHGAMGVAAFLARTQAAGVEVPRLGETLEGAVAWVLAQRLGSGPADFPQFPGSSAVMRRGWCHGGPGIGAALLAAGRLVERPDWEREGLALLRATPPPVDGFPHAGLCHGASGVGHLLHRGYAASGEESLAALAMDYHRHALDLRRPGAAVAGFPVDYLGQVRPDPGFLMGPAGIALAFLAATSDVAPDWDRALLSWSPPA